MLSKYGALPDWIFLISLQCFLSKAVSYMHILASCPDKISCLKRERFFSKNENTAPRVTTGFKLHHLLRGLILYHLLYIAFIIPLVHCIGILVHCIGILVPCLDILVHCIGVLVHYNGILVLCTGLLVHCICILVH